MATGAAAILNVMIAVAARGVTGQVPRVVVGGDNQSVSLIQIVMATVLAGVAAWVVSSILGRITDRPNRSWLTVALIVLAVSLLGPLGSGEDGSSKVALAAMHIATAAVIVPVMRGSAFTRDGAR